MATVSEPTLHRWTREQYYAMADAGLFAGHRVELIEGQVIDMSPKRSSHSTGVALSGAALQRAFGPGYHVRFQEPLALSNHSEPEPDLAVVVGGIRDYAATHPTAAALVVEVADSSLHYDRTYKMSLYALSGIPEYWIVNLVDLQLEVYQQPHSDAAQPFGAGYQLRVVYGPSGSTSSLAAAGAILLVADLLP